MNSWKLWEFKCRLHSWRFFSSVHPKGSWKRLITIGKWKCLVILHVQSHDLISSDNMYTHLNSLWMQAITLTHLIPFKRNALFQPTSTLTSARYYFNPYCPFTSARHKIYPPFPFTGTKHYISQHISTYIRCTKLTWITSRLSITTDVSYGEISLSKHPHTIPIIYT